jgi:tRNA threonylcarbamoyladenosine biosynthesis protein TsaB
MSGSGTILAMDLSTPHGHVVVWNGGRVVYEAGFTSDRSHNSMLYDPLRAALEAAGEKLALVVVGTGPGSYTGVRISISAAHGIALSRQVPVIGLPSIAALDDAARYTVVGDARRGMFYQATVERGHLIGAVKLADEAATRAWVRSLTCPVFTADPTVPVADLEIACRAPSAQRLAATASALGEEAVWTLTERGVEPLYVQEAFITTAKAKVKPASD